jgi:hypothetical protein
MDADTIFFHDANGDGVLDLSSRTAGTTCVTLGPAWIDGAQPDHCVHSASVAASWILLGDFDGDGHRDLLQVVRQQPGQGWGPTETFVHIWLGPVGQEVLAGTQDDSHSWPEGDAVVGDVDGDGDDDIAISSMVLNGLDMEWDVELYDTWLGDEGDWTLLADDSEPVGALLQFVDIDGDGANEIVFGGSGTTRVTGLLPQGRVDVDDMVRVRHTSDPWSSSPKIIHLEDRGPTLMLLEFDMWLHTDVRLFDLGG